MTISRSDEQGGAQFIFSRIVLPFTKCNVATLFRRQRHCLSDMFHIPFIHPNAIMQLQDNCGHIAKDTLLFST